MASTTAEAVDTPRPARVSRTRYWILPKLQARFIAWLVAVSSVVATTVSWAILLVVWSPLGTHMMVNVDPEKLFWDACVRVLLTTVLLIGIFGLVALMVGLIMSHKVAGPLYRIGVVAAQVAQGHYRCRVSLRRGDYIQEFAGQINALLDHVEARVREQQGALAVVHSKLSELEKAMSEGTAKPEQIEKELQAALCAIQKTRVAELAEDTPYT